MSEVNLDSLRINYHFFGRKNRSTPTILLIHGAGQSSLSWENQFELLESYERFNSIVLDLPGHGDSSGNGFQTIKEYSDIIKTFVDKLNLEELIPVGHSMGGRIAQVYTINNPENVIGCVLVGTAARLRATKTTLDLVQNNYERFCRMAAQNSFSENADNESRKLFYDRLRYSSQTTCINDLIACDEFDVADKINEIKIPTLIISSEDDILAPHRYSKFIQEKIINSKLHVMKKAGHFCMIEKPEEFNRLLIEYLNFL